MADRAGVPLDERCGMVNRFMVPELERVMAFLGARLVPVEVGDSLGEVLPEPPSRTAIQHVLTTVGQCAEDGAEQLELALQGAAPLDPEVEEPERVDVRYAARMPEAKMTTLVNGLVEQTARALQQGGYDHRVVLADGKREIWRIVDEHGVFEGFTRILDFYHAAQHLSMAAEHLFRQKVGEGGSLVSILAAQTAPYTQRRGGLDPLPFLPPSQTPKTIGPLSPGDHRNGLLSQQPGQNGIRWLSRLGLDHLQWPCGGRRQDHRRPPTQTQRHAMDPPRRSANPQPTSPGAIETMGCFLELVSPADHAHNNPEKGSVKTRLHPFFGGYYLQPTPGSGTETRPPQRLDMAPRCPPSDPMPRQLCGAPALATRSNRGRCGIDPSASILPLPVAVSNGGFQGVRTPLWTNDNWLYR